MTALLDRLRPAVADRYTVDREVGRGGMATVFLAQDRKHARRVALKVLHPELAATLGPDRFLREIQIAASLQHPHILPLYDSGQTEKQGDTPALLFYVMPFVEGESLRDRLNKERQLPVEDAVRIARDVAAALDYAHRHGVVHRDIKPENVMLHEGEAIVTDFGIAKAVSAAGAENLTQTGMAVGTPAYMSPEQATGEGEPDGRSDVYSLGCMLYEMLAGEAPFGGPTAQAIITKRFTEPVPSVRAARAAVTGELEQIVTRSLAKNPADRFATAAQLAQALGSPSVTTPPSTTPVGQAASPAPKSIAVLPFNNMSADPENEYFCEGMAEEIINSLMKIHALRVASRTSTFALKGQKQDIRKIGEQLGVSTVLEGSVRKGGHRLRITAQLINVADGYQLWSERYDREMEDIFDIQDEIADNIVKALRVISRSSAFAFKGQSLDIRKVGEQLDVSTVLEGSIRKAGNRLRITAQLISVVGGHHLWSERYDRELEDVFAIQDEIAENIVKALRVVLSEDEKRAIETAPTADIEAYDFYLRGRQFLHQWRRRSVEYARRMFERAIELDPGFARAYAGIADCCSFMYTYWDASATNLERADAASQKALDLDPNLAEAHVSRGLALAFSKRFEEAETEFKAAIRLNPKLFEAHYFFGRALLQQGRYAEAAESFGEAHRIRPDDYQAAHFLAQAYVSLNRPADTEAARRRALQIIERHLELNPEDSRALNLGANLLVQLESTAAREKALEWSRRALAIDPEDSGMLYNVACLHAVLGETEDAMGCLEKAIQCGFGLKGWIENDPDVASLRGDPRFKALLAKL